MRRHAPFEKFVNDLFNNEVGLRPLTPTALGTNVYEEAGKLVFEIEMPGVIREDVQVRFENNELSVNGEVRRNEDVKSEQFISVGRRYGKFERRFALPEGVDVDNPKKISAKLADGILRVNLPLQESLQPETIEIKVT